MNRGVEDGIPTGRLIVNELARRPHNPGHFSLDACLASQFEQQLRAVCHLPLGDTKLLRPAVMANLLGDLWGDPAIQPTAEPAEPDWAAALSDPSVTLHLYGKTDARSGRNMGHLTALADTPYEALAKVTAARARLAATR